MGLADEYSERHATVLTSLAQSLESHLGELLDGVARIDRISARAKSISRFMEKAAKIEDGKKKYSDPIHEIQDQIGARVICFYLSDVDRISSVLEPYFKAVEARRVTPDRDSEFGYFGKHYVQFIPTEVINPDWDKRLVPDFFELQIKTLFQHAWSEADHDLGYKPGETDLTSDQKRRVAFTAAQAWGADRLFNELFGERNPPTPSD